MPFTCRGKFESRCVKRTDLLEILERELPEGTVRYSSKIVSIEESGNFKLVHLADGSIFRTKVTSQFDLVNNIRDSYDQITNFMLS